MLRGTMPDALAHYTLHLVQAIAHQKKFKINFRNLLTKKLCVSEHACNIKFQDVAKFSKILAAFK